MWSIGQLNRLERAVASRPFADATRRERPSADHATAMSTGAVLLARHYTWRSAGESLAALTERLTLSGLIRC